MRPTCGSAASASSTPMSRLAACTVALLLDVDPIGLVRDGDRRASGLDQYVNDRPYVASSLLSVALVEAFGSAMNGRSRERPGARRRKDAVDAPPGRAAMRGRRRTHHASVCAARLYASKCEREPLDARFPEWGASDSNRLTLRGEQTVQDLLTHLYVLMPVLDNAKHYYVGADEVDKLLQKGERWLPPIPKRTDHTPLSQLSAGHDPATRWRNQECAQDESRRRRTRPIADRKRRRQTAEEPMRLNDARMQAALEAVRALQPPARRVLDLGCGEGRLLQTAASRARSDGIVGVDVAAHTLERAAAAPAPGHAAGTRKGPHAPAARLACVPGRPFCGLRCRRC